MKTLRQLGMILWIALVLLILISWAFGQAGFEDDE